MPDIILILLVGFAGIFFSLPGKCISFLLLLWLPFWELFTSASCYACHVGMCPESILDF